MTPAYATVAEIFQAACDCSVNANRRGAEDGKFHELAGAVVDELLAASREGGPQLLLATTKGEMDRQCAWMGAMMNAGPTEFPLPTLGSALAELARGRNVVPGYVVSTACTSGLLAIIEAAMQVQRGDVNRAMAVGADVAGGFVRDGFAALKAVSPTTCRPFDLHRNGLMLGSGAAGCLLSHAESAEAVVSGWGVSNDAVHMTAPDREARGLIRTIRQALECAELEPREIDVVFAHGTGTPFNDAMEAVAIERVFLQNGAAPAVTAVKGLIGHTLGAAGLIEAVLGVEMIRRGVILPVVGLQMPERAEIDFVREPRPREIRHVLKIGSGFGGMNAALVLSRRPAVTTQPRAANCERRPTPFVAAVSDEDAILAMARLIEHVPEDKRAATGLIIGTTLGCLETDREFERSRREAGGRYASPAAFSRTLPSTVAAELALKFRLTGPSLVVSAGDRSAALALRRAMAWMEEFRLEYCVAGGVEWTGEGIGVPSGKRVGLLLMARRDDGIGRIEALQESRADLSAARDRSLEALIRAIEQRTRTDVGGVRISL